MKRKSYKVEVIDAMAEAAMAIMSRKMYPLLVIGGSKSPDGLYWTGPFCLTPNLSLEAEAIQHVLQVVTEGVEKDLQSISEMIFDERMRQQRYRTK